MIKNTYKKPTTIIIVNGEGLNAFPLRSGRKGCPFSLLLLDTILEVLATTINQKKKISVHKLQKKKQNYLHITRSCKIPRELKNLTCKFSKVTGYMINI